MGAVLVLALIVVPLVEIYILVQVGQVLGPLPTVALLLLMSLVGAFLLRREGAKTWRAFRTALGSGRVPAREVADGALVVFGGALLLTPGFATDAFGLVCVVPPTRAVLRRLLTGFVTRRLGVAGVVGGLAAESRRSRSGPTSRRRGPGGVGDRHGTGEVVEGEVVGGDVAGGDVAGGGPAGGGPAGGGPAGGGPAGGGPADPYDPPDPRRPPR